jgi:hypothetical protein
MGVLGPAAFDALAQGPGYNVTMVLRGKGQSGTSNSIDLGSK